jgi:hypothetical protein
MDLATKVIAVRGSRRTLRERAYSFVCRECGRSVVRIGYPGRPPLYCDDLCVHMANSASALIRMRRLRHRRATDQAAGGDTQMASASLDE